MTVDPTGWSVVVVGRWNTGILTPQGIASRLFDVDTNTPLSIQIPLDALNPYKVLSPDQTLAVLASSTRLEVQSLDCETDQLEHAKQVATKALNNLPETPVTAAGINCNWIISDPPSRLVEASVSCLDHELSDQDRVILARSLSRSITWNGGKANIGLEYGEDRTVRVAFNFHLDSKNSADLMEWLGQRLDPMMSFTRDVLDSLDVSFEDGVPN